DRLTTGVHGEHQLGLRVVPAGEPRDADLRADTDGGQHRRLGEDLGVRTDPDLQILRPETLLDQHLLRLGSLRGPGHDVADGTADDVADARPDLGGAGRVALGLLLDDAFQHAAHERDAARLHRVQVARREQVRPAGPAAQGVVEELAQRPGAAAASGGDHVDGVGAFQEGRHRRRGRGQIYHQVTADGRDAWTRHVRVVHAGHQRRGLDVAWWHGVDLVDG